MFQDRPGGALVAGAVVVGARPGRRPSHANDPVWEMPRRLANTSLAAGYNFDLQSLSLFANSIRRL